MYFEFSIFLISSPPHNIMYCIIVCANQKYYLSIVVLTWRTSNCARQMLHILQHNPRLDLDAKELKVKFMSLKEIQLHEHIVQ